MTAAITIASRRYAIGDVMPCGRELVGVLRTPRVVLLLRCAAGHVARRGTSDLWYGCGACRSAHSARAVAARLGLTPRQVYARRARAA